MARVQGALAVDARKNDRPWDRFAFLYQAAGGAALALGLAVIPMPGVWGGKRIRRQAADTPEARRDKLRYATRLLQRGALIQELLARGELIGVAVVYGTVGGTVKAVKWTGKTRGNTALMYIVPPVLATGTVLSAPGSLPKEWESYRGIACSRRYYDRGSDIPVIDAAKHGGMGGTRSRPTTSSSTSLTTGDRSTEDEIDDRFGVRLDHGRVEWIVASQILALGRHREQERAGTDQDVEIVNDGRLGQDALFDRVVDDRAKDAERILDVVLDEPLHASVVGLALLNHQTHLLRAACCMPNEEDEQEPQLSSDISVDQHHHALCELAPELEEDRVDRGFPKGLLGREMICDEPLILARERGDLSGRCAVEAVGRKHVERGPNDPLSRLLRLRRRAVAGRPLGVHAHE